MARGLGCGFKFHLFYGYLEQIIILLLSGCVLGWYHIPLGSVTNLTDGGENRFETGRHIKDSAIVCERFENPWGHERNTTSSESL